MPDIGICRSCKWYDESLKKRHNGMYEWSIGCMQLMGVEACRNFTGRNSVGIAKAMKRRGRKWYCGWKSRGYREIARGMHDAHMRLAMEYDGIEPPPSCDMMVEQTISKWNGDQNG